MHYRGCVSVTPRILHVVVNRIIVSRNGLEGRGVRIGECAAGCAEDFANAQVFKKLLGSKVCAVSGMSVVEFMLSSFPSLFFEGWCVAESGVG